MPNRLLTMRIRPEEDERLALIAGHYGLSASAVIRMLLKREADALTLPVRRSGSSTGSQRQPQRAPPPKPRRAPSRSAKAAAPPRPERAAASKKPSQAKSRPNKVA